jgi:molybdopterin molybdotransferase
MRSPKEAIAEILEAVTPLGTTESIELCKAGGRVLAAAPVSDVNVPPFEKSMMDGYAVRSSDCTESDWRLKVIGESRAGFAFPEGVQAGQAVEIYTGAPLPKGTDAVQMIENTSRSDDWVASQGRVPVAQNVSHLGEILSIGRPVLSVGRRISAMDLSLLAAVGADPVQVFRRPRVTILTTGDELVPAHETPGPDQIREGNTLFLADRTQARVPGCDVIHVGLVPDDPDVLRAAFARAFEDGDVLITTGGVSMGRYDLVGPTLEALGVQPILHKVAIKPGKPIWFGKLGDKPVFGLPGNPVSSLLGFDVFVQPALSRLGGATGAEATPQTYLGRWAGKPKTGGDRQLNLPAMLNQADDGVWELRPAPWKGSADIAGLADAQAFAIIEPFQKVQPGDLLEWRPFNGAGLA